MQRTLSATRLAGLLGDFDREPAYAGLADGIRALVTDGRVPVGVRLPSERELTEALGVSRTTVARAYAALRDARLLQSRRGSGSVVALPEGGGYRGDHLLSPAHAADDAIDLTISGTRPLDGVLDLFRRAVEVLPGHLAGTGYFPSGLPALREAVAAHYEARGLPTDPAQVVVVPGALAGVAIAARALLGPGDRVVVESPTYPNAIATLQRAGGRLLGAEPDPEALRTTLRQVLPRAAYLIPDFHNPTGRLLDAAGREQLAETLRRTRTTPIVDESMVMLGLDGPALPPPFASYAADTVTVGSTSKPFWGGLRVGWLRVPERHLDAVLAARLALDLGSPVLEQLVATELLTDGADLLARRRDGLRESRDALVAMLRERLPDWTFEVPGGGLTLWCGLPAPLSTALTARAARHDLLLAPGPAFAPEGGLDRHLRIPFSRPVPVLADAVDRLAAAWAETLADPDPRGGTRPGPAPTLVA